MTDERERFEAAMKKAFSGELNFNHPAYVAAWVAWQAAKADARPQRMNDGRFVQQSQKECKWCEGGGTLESPTHIITCPHCGGSALAVADAPAPEPLHEDGPHALRLSKSGYSLKVGWGDEKRIVASSPRLLHEMPPAAQQQWLDDAERLCNGWNAQPVAFALPDDARDAARYRAMKENDFTEEYVDYIRDCLNEKEGYDLDAAIDAAIAAAKET